ncbi:ParB/RepB/Spo0J family partition protein [Conexibacter sp. W3-3-2]|uniref:ParB/RepB/Spo0J family partition protein n=1 Tax=Conexibacter sp. W3-3-2 TaxID=2675227 RepID=UPI0018A97258|nr:ParB/RepB/Spo0J family partition protein [Conexibacter sp. W3-3-2]
MSPQNTSTPAVEQATVAIADVHRADGFNPRTDVVRDDDFTRLVLTIKERGVLQPIRVTAHPHGGYELLAGDRRLTAAHEAGLTEIPAIVVTEAQDEEDRLEDALIENELRVDLTALERARAYQRLRHGGRTVKAIALRFGRSQAYVRTHLHLLELPDELHAGFADATIPVSAVTGLRKLAQASRTAAVALAAEVCRSQQQDEEPWRWEDAVEHPLDVLLSLPSLPAGVYDANGQCPLEQLDLSPKAIKGLDRIEALTGSRPAGLTFTRASFQTAAALNATLGEDYRGLILGADVAAQLAADAIADHVKDLKAQRQRTAELAQQAATDAASETPSPAQGEPDPAAAEAERKAQAAAEREQQAAERETACAFNDRLGRAMVDKLSRVKLDVDALRVVTTIDLAADLGDLALRGARYGFPGWVTEETTKGGKLKRTYLPNSSEAAARARDYLKGANTPGEHAGRCIALVVMAWFADERAVAQSNRSFKTVRPSGTPWAAEIPEILERYAETALPGDERLQQLIAERTRQRAEAAANAARRDEARQIVDAVTTVEDPATVTAEQLDAAQAAMTDAFPSYSMERYDAERKLKQLREHHQTGDPAQATVQPGSDG